MDILEISGVSKRFGSVSAIDRLSLLVPEHSVFGFIGRNGAGKTTTMKMVLGFLKPDAGTIRVCGEQVQFGNAGTNKYIGYLPDVPSFYGYMTPREYLLMCGRIAKMNERRIQTRTTELLELTGLSGDRRRIKGFSRGMQQRLGIAQALLHEPKLLLCDEPTSALDPIGRKEILDILLLAKEHTTIVFSTHILSDVERICDRIGILEKGRLALQGDLSELKRSYRQDAVTLEFQSGVDLDSLVSEIRSIKTVLGVSLAQNELCVSMTDAKQTGSRILEIVVSRHLPLTKYEIAEPTLERVFLEAVQ